MKKRIRIMLFILIANLLILSGCSGKESSSKNAAADKSGRKEIMNQDQSAASPGSAKDDAKQPEMTDVLHDSQRQMVIYEANLSLRVKNFDLTMQTLEEKAEKYGGYVAESSVTKEGNSNLNGMIKIRIPAKHFQTFLHDAEGQAAEVIQRDINGEDVTEEYVDLNSRLKSKKVVEDRLLTFMKSATKTEDLLKISNDLASVQEDIEKIEGRIKYLENLTSFSTVNINLFENKVVVPDIDKDKLNTWDRSKQQFMKSTNFLLQVLSGFVVFIIGNLPVLLLLAIVGGIIFYLIKKRQKGKSSDS